MKNISLFGQDFVNVPAVNVPKTGGGIAQFDDTTDANATASDIAVGKTAYVSGSKITGTATPPTGTKQISITENGTFTEDVASYAYAEIAVDVSGGEDDLLENKLTGAYHNDRITTLRRFAFSYVTGITSIFLGNLTTIQGADAFSYCSAQTIVLPKFGIPSWSGGTYLFRDARSAKTIDLSNTGELPIYTFSACISLNTLILRSNTLVSLVSISVFDGSLFASGKSGGTLYVPQALISSYQSATNWSTILGYANNSIQAIEGSQYENYYADGTPIE